MNGHLLNNVDINELEALLLKDGFVVPVPFSEIQKFSQEMISLFCHKHAIYQIPTTELIEFLKEETKTGFTIEIGSGNGCIGRSMGVMMTDNHMQMWPDIKAIYAASKQPVITYGKDVVLVDANEAIKKFNPHNVVACWVTQKWEEGMQDGNMYGVDENQMFKDGILKYIHVGNARTHASKKLLRQRKHKELKFPWLVSRSMSKEENVIYIFESETI